MFIIGLYGLLLKLWPNLVTLVTEEVETPEPGKSRAVGILTGRSWSESESFSTPIGNDHTSSSGYGESRGETWSEGGER